MARAALAWSQDQLADASQVSKAAIAYFEREERTPMPQNRGAIRRAFEQAGLVLLPENGEGSGVRFREPGIERKARAEPEPEPGDEGAE
jgi:transcriptional regulator with XRE-family HTH domain